MGGVPWLFCFGFLAFVVGVILCKGVSIVGGVVGWDLLFVECCRLGVYFGGLTRLGLLDCWLFNLVR